MYKVLAYFKDSDDNRYEYHKGDEYPRKGYTPSAERVRGLLGKNNKRNNPVIIEVEDVETAEKTPKKVKKAEIEVETPEKAVKKPRKKAKKTE